MGINDEDFPIFMASSDNIVDRDELLGKKALSIEW